MNFVSLYSAIVGEVDEDIEVDVDLSKFFSIRLCQGHFFHKSVGL